MLISFDDLHPNVPLSVTRSVRISAWTCLSEQATFGETCRMAKALIVIDVQESFRQRPSWAELSNPDLVGQVNRLVDQARAENDLVVWVLHSEPGTGTVFDPATGHVRPLDGLRPEEGEPVLTKTSHNAFTTTNLQQILTTRGIRSLLISGIRTEQCCETTTRVGSDLGFDMTFVIDATATTPLPHWRTGVVLGTKELIKHTEYVLAERFATIATVAELTGLH
jgi:nicotinamidase-related amidase